MTFQKLNPSAGSRPGTLMIPPGAPPTRIRLVRYWPEGIEEREVENPAELGSPLSGEEKIWVDIQGLGTEATLRQIAQIFGMNPLALEDAVNTPQRAKSELYENHQLVISRIPLLDEEGDLEVPQICFIIGKNYLLTFQERFFGFFDPVRERLRTALGPIRRMGPDYLAYALIDTLVDRYYPIAEDLSHQLEELEDDIIDDPRPDTLSEIHRIRRLLVVLRRVGRPQREAVNAMIRDQTPYISESVRAFLRDTYDHISQITELVDSTREMAVGLSEIYLSNVSQKTNEVMKVLTLMASIFIPLTFIAGIYGMNFEYMPELAQRNGYFLVLIVMVALGLGMIFLFRRRGWIGYSGRRRKRQRRNY
ncbi:MAG: magnesium/cobalt transporter CorA [Deltaproteobacteria bacterium]|nr:magnesium/cobalt transporter CorA [Deltaproteobacteria bacterium]